VTDQSTRIVVLVSGSGTNLQALLDAAQNPDWGGTIVAVGADRTGIEGLTRAERLEIPTFVEKLSDHPDRGSWDDALTDVVRSHEPDIVVLAGFMKLVSASFLAAFPGKVLNTHPALCPSFPGTSAPADALAHGVKVTGATLFVVDEGMDTGPIIAQVPVPVLEDDSVASLHERIKEAERRMLVENVGRMAREGIRVDSRRVRFGQ
jgi:phosphoribosylglycinamide formyltransferase-1